MNRQTRIVPSRPVVRHPLEYIHEEIEVDGAAVVEQELVPHTVAPSAHFIIQH